MSHLSVRNVSKSFGSLRALDCVSVDVQPHSFHGLIGPNGSGKSTLLKVIAGAHLADTGTITFCGRDVSRATPYERSRAGMSLKFQITAVISELSVYDNMLLSMQVGGGLRDLLSSASRRSLHCSVIEALERFRLVRRTDDLAGELSHGEQQWLEIAMAIASNPSLLLLDEPTAGMSPEERRATGLLLAPLKQQCSLVIVEHDLDFIRECCDVLTVLDQGRVIETGAVDDIQRSVRVQQIYTTRT